MFTALPYHQNQAKKHRFLNGSFGMDVIFLNANHWNETNHFSSISVRTNANGVAKTSNKLVVMRVRHMKQDIIQQDLATKLLFTDIMILVYRAMKTEIFTQQNRIPNQ
ncbi:MAG: hypothetical protein R3A43_05010 [Bacteroidia bacterium]